MESLEPRLLLHGATMFDHGAQLTDGLAATGSQTRVVHSWDGVAIGDGESVTVIAEHHAEPGHSANPHYLVVTDEHHFAWPDKDPSTPGVIDILYDFRPLTGISQTFPNLITSAQIAVVDYALQVWKDATGGKINFVRSTTASEDDIINIGTGDLNPMGQLSGRGGVLGVARASFAHDNSTNTHAIRNGVAWMDYSERWETKIGNGNRTGTYDYFTVAAHEIGHTLGLDHTDSIWDLVYSSYSIEKTEASIGDKQHISIPYSAGPGLLYSPSRDPQTTEAGGYLRLEVAIRTKPTAPVTFTFTTDDATEGYVPDYDNYNTLTFTPDNWIYPQVLFVYSVDDTILDGNVKYKLVALPAASDDPAYNGLDADDLTITSVDNEKKSSGGGRDHGGSGTSGTSSGDSCDADSCAMVSLESVEDELVAARTAIVTPQPHAAVASPPGRHQQLPAVTRPVSLDTDWNAFVAHTARQPVEPTRSEVIDFVLGETAVLRAQAKPFSGLRFGLPDGLVTDWRQANV